MGPAQHRAHSGPEAVAALPGLIAYTRGSQSSGEAGPSGVVTLALRMPPGAERATIIELARNDLEVATEYTLALQSSGAPNGITAFAALPVALAEATLDKLETSTATKIARPTVFRITRQVNRSVARGEPPLRLRSQSQSGFERMRSIFSTTR